MKAEMTTDQIFTTVIVLMTLFWFGFSVFVSRQKSPSRDYWSPTRRALHDLKKSKEEKEVRRKSRH